MAALRRGKLLFVFGLLVLGLSACSAQQAGQTTFTVLTYNVENLFDVDGVALFEDYQIDQSREPLGYSRRKFLSKLQTITAVLQAVNDGEGPEIILFQELEADFTPDSSVSSAGDFVEEYADITVESMLTSEWSDAYAGIPAEAWLLKSLSEQGMSGYHVAVTASRGLESGIAHANAIFSKFPLREVQGHPLRQARDILEAEIDVKGRPFYVYVNHWKSGASNPEREPIRVENAKVLRGLLDARLRMDPQADILVAGDLNSHYNHSILYPDIQTGINDVLGSTGAEDFSQGDLYNLWFELPPEARYSEVWRGRRGSLMNMLLTPGLYDAEGISYVDGSYNKLVLPGLNADAIGRPLAWHFTGSTGGGASDHFPIYASFRIGSFQARDPLSLGRDAPDFERPLNVYDYTGPLDLADGSFLNPLNDAELAPYVGHLYTVNARVKSIHPLRIEVGTRVWPAYYTNRSMIGEAGLPAYLKRHEGRVRLVVKPGFYRGASQLVVENILGTW